MSVVPVVAVLLVWAFQVTGIFAANPLKCYQCSVNDNSQCTDEFLKPCAPHPASDICMTQIKKTENEGLVITKRCALGPCELRDRTSGSALGFGECDRSKSNYNCVACCKEDGCNKDGAQTLKPASGLGFLILFVVIATVPSLMETFL